MAYTGEEHFTTPHQEAYKTLDELLKAVGQLPMNFIMDRPPLQKAVNRGLEAIDLAVKEGHYVVPPSE